MWTASVTVDIDEVFRATEVLADLWNVAEVLFHPLRMVAF
jgi:hypothetical protein